MIFCYSNDDKNIIRQSSLTPPDKLPDDCFWLDIIEPIQPEMEWLKQFFHETPDVEELEEIEESSRLFIDQDGLHISALFPQRHGKDLETLSVSFTLRKDLLITLRNEDISLFRLMRSQLKTHQKYFTSPESCLIGLFNIKVDYLADLIEEQYQFVDAISIKEFNEPDFDFDNFLQNLTRIQNNTGKLHLNLIDAQRSLRFLLKTTNINTADNKTREIIELLRDIDSLIPHTTFLFDKINFLIDACMGFININQNKIIKIFSVLAVVFMPPTLIASIYGMNFSHMPELSWKYGYVASILIMLLSSTGTYSLFKYKKWL